MLFSPLTPRRVACFEKDVVEARAVIKSLTSEEPPTSIYAVDIKHPTQPFLLGAVTPRTGGPFGKAHGSLNETNITQTLKGSSVTAGERRLIPSNV